MRGPFGRGLYLPGARTRHQSYIVEHCSRCFGGGVLRTHSHSNYGARKVRKEKVTVI